MKNLKPRAYLLFIIGLFYLSPSPSLASTYQDVTNFINANPAPSGCVNWVEEVGSGYKVWRRCSNAQSFFQMWVEGPAGYYVYNRDNRKCDGSNTWDNDHALPSCTWDRPCSAYGVTTVYTVNIYCNGSVTQSIKYPFTGDPLSTFSSPCLLYQSSSTNCRSYDALLAEFTVDQCLNKLTNTYESCAQNCKDPVDKASSTAAEICGDGIDNNCNGQVDEGCAICTEGETRKCAYTGPSGTEGVGICKAGTQACTNGQWGSCQGEIIPQTEICDNKDNNCNGKTDETCLGCTPNSTGMGSSSNLASGNLYHSQSLLRIPNSKLETEFTLSYNSLDTSAGPIGRGWDHNYNLTITPNPDGSLAFKQGDGNVIYFRQSGGVYYPENRSGEHSTIIKNADATYTRTTKEGITYSFNTSGRLTRIKDRNNNTTTLSYNGDNLTSITDSSGRQIQLTYDSHNHLVQLRTPNSELFTLSYTGDSLVSVTDPQGNTWQYTYDANGRMITKTDPQGYTTTYTYDTNGRITQSQDPERKTKTISYDPANNTAVVTEKDGGVWIYRYDPLLDVNLKTTDPLGSVTRYAYDTNKNLTSKTEPDGTTTTYTYDAQGNMTSTTDALNQTTNYTYNDYGQVTSITAPDNTTTTYEYDANGNLTKTTDAAGASTSYQYDSKGNIAQITNANNQTTALSYDQYNNLSSITDPTGATISFAYDTNGNMTSQTDASGATTYFQYNSLNQLIKVTDSLGNITQYAYDKNGNKTSERDANGKTTFYEYNYKGQLLKITDALTNATKYTYGGTGCPSCPTSPPFDKGGSGGITSITDAKNQTTTYEYDTLGRLVKETDPLGNVISYGYDSKGNLVSKTDTNGATITYIYDSLNRLTSINYPDAAKITFTYDVKGNILTATNQHITYYFTYDVSGRLLTVTDSTGRVLQYAYDPLGNKVKLTYPDGSVVEYNYDKANRLASIINGGGRTYAYQYDSLGRRIKLTMPNGTYATYAYDTSGRLTNLIHKTSSGSIIDSFTYSHDKVGNRLSKTETDVKYSYSYDAIYRLLQSLPTKLQGKDKEQENKAEAFTYDPVGNRLTGPETKDRYTYNQGNQLTGDRKRQYEYDRNGNLIKKTEIDDEGETETWTYSYDYENQLIKVVKQEEDETKTVTFKYDPFGRRIEKKVTETPSPLAGEGGGEGETKTYTYIYDNEDIILEYLTKTEDGESKTEKTRYVHGPGIDEPLAIQRKDETYYYHADGLGSIVALTDQKQKTVESYTYTSFGEVKRKGDKVKNTYTFTGREWDKEIGLYYYRARYMDPKTGRFISFDPIVHPVNGPPVKSSCSQTINYPTFESLKESPQKLNPFVYVQNNPVNYIDPTGLITTKTICKVGCGVLGSACLLACPASGPLSVLCISSCILATEQCMKSCDKQCN